MRKLGNLTFHSAVVIFLVFLGWYALNIISITIVYIADKKLESTGFQLDYHQELDNPVELVYEWYLDGWWSWVINPKPCDIHNPEISGRCGILEMSKKNSHGNSQSEPSSVVIVYSDASQLYSSTEQTYFPDCKKMSTNNGWDYTYSKEQKSATPWKYKTGVTYYRLGIQIAIPGYVNSHNQEINYLPSYGFDQNDPFNYYWDYYHAFVPQGGALVIYSTTAPMFVANPNSAVSYNMVQKNENLKSFIMGCINK